LLVERRVGVLCLCLRGTQLIQAVEGRRAARRKSVGGGQRRQVTVLFCDLASSTELAGRIDPEDMRDVLHAYLNAFAARIEAKGGFIARYLGDGIMAYFGSPLAHEDDPARAVHAALDVIEASKNLAPPHGHRLSVRCGLATGLSVVGHQIGKGASAERGVIGPAPNLAARLQAMAQPGEAVICATTARMTEGLFRRRDLGGLTLKGFATPERAFAVLSGGSELGRLAVRAIDVSAPMVGRLREQGRLAAAWRQTQSGQMGFVSLVGEPGIGKSRLIAEFRRSLDGAPHIWFQAGGDPMLEGQPYGLAGRLIRGRLGAGRDVSPAAVAPLLERAGLPGDRAELVTRAISGDEAMAIDAPGQLDAEDRRLGVSGVLVDWTIAQARRKPTVLVVEDLHWADPSSLDLLRALIAARPDVPLLVIISARPEFRPSWRFAVPPRVIRVDRLSDFEIAGVAANAAAQPVAPARLASLVARAEGNPLFAEELAAHLGADPRRKGGLPETLIGLLTARLDATGEAAELAWAAAAMGRHFDAAMLGKVARLSQRRVRQGLDALIGAGIISADSSGFEFRHALIHEAAYGALVKEDRQALHRRAALALTRAGRGQDIAIARHWREAGEPRRAADTYRDLGRRNAGDRAYGEAAQAYSAALEVLSDLPPSAARDREDMEISSALANALQITDGYAAPAPAVAAARARTLAERLGDSARMFTQLSADWMAASSSGDYGLARDLVARAMPLAEAAGAAETLSTAYMMQMTSAYRVGALSEGEAAFRAGEPYFRNAAFLRRPGAVPQTFGNGAVIAWLLGHEAAARKRTARVVTHSLRAESAYARVFAGYMAAMQFVIMGEGARGAALARQAMMAADAESFPQFAATARIVLGRALAITGRRQKGIALMTDGIGRMSINGSRNGMTMYLTWLAQSHIEAGDKGTARTVSARALSINPSERFFRAEALRVSALSVDARAQPQAIIELTDAINLARAMGSVWQEERARASLNDLTPKIGARRAVSRRS